MQYWISSLHVKRISFTVPLSRRLARFIWAFICCHSFVSTIDARFDAQAVAGRKAVWEGQLGALQEAKVAAVEEGDTLLRWGRIFSTIQAS